ncbi:hypothetical protein M0805_003808, partial [Coniferiporia weirii]
PAAVERLDDATRSKIRSTQILTSLPQIISELVQNSLDAGAKNIDVGIDYDDWMCWVRDDGSGVNKDGLAFIAQGMKGGRYSSSKAYSTLSLELVNTFGFRGEALASAADLSLIEISSRTARSKESWSVILKGGEELYYGPSLRWRREQAGTTVSIRDAFYNLPIRRRSHPGAARTIELVQRELESFALVFTHVAFSLRDESKTNRGGPDKARVLSIPRTSSTLKAFRHIFGRALVECTDDVNVQSGEMKLEGFISLVGAHSKCDIAKIGIDVNRHLLEQCQLHRVIDQKFASSTFHKHAADETGESANERPGARRSPRKAERRPVYVLNLTIPPREIDNCLDPAKTVIHFQDQGAVASFLADVTQSFLVRHGFNAPLVERPLPTSGKRQSKRGRADASDEMELDDYNVASPPIKGQSPSKRPKMREVYIREKQDLSLEHDEGELTWVDPTTNRTYLVDARTGNSYVRDQQSEGLGNSGSRPPIQRRTVVDKRWLKQVRSPCVHSHEEANEDETNEIPEWIKRALEANGTFAPNEPAIPHLPSAALHNSTNDELGQVWRTPWMKQFKRTFTIPHQSLGGLEEVPAYSFTKESLAEAQVIEQVDRKFIACIIKNIPRSQNSNEETFESEDDASSPSGRTLVLVDQHAADERVRVERYLKALCLGFLDSEGVGVERRALDPPVPVLLTRFERDRLAGSRRIKKSFQNWGFDVIETRAGDIREAEGEHEDGCGMVYLKSVPEVVADKLLTGTGDDLREVVKSYLARIEAEGADGSSEDLEQKLRGVSVGEVDVDEFTWLRALRFCPHGLIELVNSKACRGAIMFNDRLSGEQCRRLIRQLSMTAFPFQCAHGRPSVVPLTAIHYRDTEEHRVTTSGALPHPRSVDWSSLI